MNAPRTLLCGLVGAGLSLFTAACDKAPPSPTASSAAPAAPAAPAAQRTGAKLVLPAPTAGHAHLTGRILRGAAPAAGVKVEVCTTPQCGNILQEKTDANGEYAFRNVDPGKYALLTVYEIGDATSKALWPKGVEHALAAGAIETADGTL
jgi:hypothetical protein